MAKSKLTMAVMAILAVLLVVVACAAPAPEPAGPAPEKEVTRVLRIGVLGPMEFFQGKSSLGGCQMAANEINAAGGIKAGKDTYIIEVIPADTNEWLSIPDAVSAIERSISVDKADFLMGCAKSEAAMAMQEVMADNKIILMATAVSGNDLNKRVADDYDRYKYWFRFWCPAAKYLAAFFQGGVQPIIDTVRNELDVEKPKIALVIEQSAFLEPFVPLSEKLYPAMGCEVVGLWRPSFKATDVSTELAAIKEAGAHIILSHNSGPLGITLAKQWGQLKIPAAMGGWNSEATIGGTYWESTGGAAQYLAFENWAARIAMTEKTIPFWDKCLEELGEVPNAASIAAYDNTYILKEAIERAGTIETDAVIVEMEKTDRTGIMGRVTLSPLDGEQPHDVMWGPGYTAGVYLQWMTADPNDWAVYWPDGKELHPAIIEMTGGIPGWADVKYPGTVDYQLPPWMVEYWKGK